VEAIGQNVDFKKEMSESDLNTNMNNMDGLVQDSKKGVDSSLSFINSTFASYFNITIPVR
jgi:hypothetical protein